MSASLLLVDDDPALLEALPITLTLRVPSVQIETCPSPVVALELIRAGRYDTLITDLRMPQMDGATLAEEIRKVRDDIPVLLITGAADRELASRALHAGAFDFLLKPFDRDVIAASVRAALEWHRLKKKLSHHQLLYAGLSVRYQDLTRAYHEHDHSPSPRVRNPETRTLLERSHRTVERSFERIARSLVRMESRIRLCEYLLARQAEHVADLREQARRRALTRLFPC